MATFIDFSKALDSISRSRMEDILYKYGLPTKIVAAVMSMHSRTTARVETTDGCSADFEVEAGVLQGDTLPHLFVIVVCCQSGTNSIGSSTSNVGKGILPHHTSDIKDASDSEQWHGGICGAGKDKSDTIIVQKHSIQEPGDGWGRDTSGRAHQCTRGTL